MKHLWIILPLLFILSCEDKDKEKEEVEEKVYTPTGRIILQSTNVGKETLIVVDAQDEMGIDKVEFFIDDDSRLTDNTEPYEYLWKSIKDLEGKHKIKVITSNLQGNSVSDSVEVTVRITNIVIPQDFSTITNDSIKEYLDVGDTITVHTGTYNFINVDFIDYDSLFIIGVGGAENVILDGNNEHSVINISNSLLQGFTIQNGKTGSGAGIISYGGTIRNCIIRNNEATSLTSGGGGISVNGKGTIENCLIYNNIAYYNGGGISIGEQTNLTLINNVIYGNQVKTGWGAGLHIKKGKATLYNNIFYMNKDLGDNLSNVVSLNNNHFGTAKYNLGISGGIFGDENLGHTDPKFVDLINENFKLNDDSPCIDEGHPDSQYNDTDGTRNDIGAYGGKYGVWNN